MISQTAEYALRAMVYLAKLEGEACTNQRLAQLCHVPEGYLAKVMQVLAKAGLVHSQRGKKGGFRLRQDAAGVSAYEVVQTIDPIKRVTGCPLAREDHCTELCPLHKCLDDAAALLEDRLKNTFLSELAGHNAGVYPD